MEPRGRARYAVAVTLAVGKMHEYRVPIEEHIALPPNLNLAEQFPLAVGTIGDFAAERARGAYDGDIVDETPREHVIFAAEVLHAYDEALPGVDISLMLRLLAASAFYLGDLPGTAMVLTRRIAPTMLSSDDPLAIAVRFALDRPWMQTGGAAVKEVAVPLLSGLRQHFATGFSESVPKAIRDLRKWAYDTGTPHELLLADVLAAVAHRRIENSAWKLLPHFSEIPSQRWAEYLGRESAIKEMWPSQRMLGGAGLYRGEKAVVQMPTSAGKTRAIELVIRSAFLSGRTKLAVVVAPFRSLCQEIAENLSGAFTEDGYSVNQLSDALQLDFTTALFDFLEIETEKPSHVIVLTPEKFLYVLRQEPKLVKELGLIIYDEGHQFDNGTRGVTYELLLTSIKRLLAPSAQSVLVSAVIQNPTAIAKWLFEDESKVVSDSWLQTRRSVAFVSLPPGKTGQLRFLLSGESEQEFFVPRVIVPETLQARPRETIPRVFPTHESTSIALCLALRLVQNGGVAIYVRTKASAAKLVRDAVTETFARGVSLPPPAESSDAGEIQRLTHLFRENFGEDSYLTGAAALGVFAHHGSTPHGIRLAIEHAARGGRIRLVVCTSTLAQGVNLPIRYLLITSPMQGREAIRPRDFHNLMGRAGRAGMYGEGTVIFTDHKLFDERELRPQRWEAAQTLLRSESATPTGSSLLCLLEPMTNDYGSRKVSSPSPEEIATLLIENPAEIYERIGNLSDAMVRSGFSTSSLRRQLDTRRETIEAIESFLMTFRGDSDNEDFVEMSQQLSRETLAYFFATEVQQSVIEKLFERIAARIETLAPNKAQQAHYGRTLLGIDACVAIDQWVAENLLDLRMVESTDEMLELLWPILTRLSADIRLRDTTPVDAIGKLARGWLSGAPFKELLSSLTDSDASLPHGKGRRAFSIDAVVDICEQTFAFEFALLLAAIKESYVDQIHDSAAAVEFSTYIDLLQKRLKYGLPSQDTICYYEAGFAERVVAQQVAAAVFWESAESASDVRSLVRRYYEDVEEVIVDYPSYFSSVFDKLTS